jgi:hypothetical protein
VNAVSVVRARPPLVVDLGRGYFAWIERGHGFVLSRCAGQWVPLTEAVVIAGHVMKAPAVGELVLEFGRPM